MGIHIYLYLHATLTAEITVDVTKMARDKQYREFGRGRRHEIAAAFFVSFADVARNQHPRSLDLDLDSVDWDEFVSMADQPRPAGRV